MAALLVLFLCLAILGLVLSLIAHVTALFGLPQPLGGATWWLHLGTFVVFVPAAITGKWLAKNFNPNDYWGGALRGCPAWMVCLTFGFFIYAVLNFMTFMAVVPPQAQPGGMDAPPVVFRGFSGHWMAFYAGACAILYSALVVRKQNATRRCPNQHPVSLAALYCEQCLEYVGEPDRGPH